MIQPTPAQLLQLHGCSIIPVRKDKRPSWDLLPQTWDEVQRRNRGQWKPFQLRRPTDEELTKWTSAHTPAYAIVTGEISRRITLDFDGEAGTRLAKEWGVRPHRRTGSGGFHLDVVHPGWYVPTLNGKAKAQLGEKWPGLDIKADGGYAIALGSNENGSYVWLRDPEPDSMDVVPAEVWEFLAQYSKPTIPNSVEGTDAAASGTGGKANYGGAARVNSERLILKAVEAAALSGRNNAGFNLACQLRDNGYSESEALFAMRSYRSRVPSVNAKGKSEPYSDAEVNATVREAFGKPAREPWSPLLNASPRHYLCAQRSGLRVYAAGGDGQSRNNTNAPPDDPVDLLAPLLNDCGNAERLKLHAGDDLRFCHGFKKWLIWDGTRWVIDTAGQIFRYGKATILEFLRQAMDAKNEAAEKFARQSLDSRRLNAMISLAECELPITPEQLDTNRHLLNFNNATVDLRTGELRRHCRNDFITKRIELEYRSGAFCPVFLTTLTRLMGGGPDASESELQRAEVLVGHLQKAIGYSATGITSEKVVFVVYGGGNNGKTTILITVFRCLGDYSSVVLIDSIMSRQENNNASADIADLRGARFVMTSETEEGQRLAEGKLKRLTQGVAGGKIKACRKYENPIEFTETHKLWMDCNHKPIVRGTDAAIWNRIHLIPFTVTIPSEEIDRDLPAKLMGEAQGIAAWIVAGAGRWFREGLGRPPEVAEAVREYREEMDQIGRFIEECCVVTQYGTAKSRDLYVAYHKWADESGESAVTETAFASKLRERDFVKRHTEHGGRYEGIGLRA